MSINPELDPIIDYDNQLEIVDEYEKGDDESIVGERLRGDGQEQDQNKKVDDDEDRRNPQYIPKRGYFYEHDDRTLEDGDTASNEEESEPKNEPEAPIKKEEKGEKWGHDLYIEKEQLPKSKQELINAYGYDIRNEDGPPRARRRRRYGRGPNKYTRNWEDEDAYSRQQVRTKKNVKEDFPPLEIIHRPKTPEKPKKPKGVKQPPIPSQSYSNSNRAKGDCYDLTKDMANLKVVPPVVTQVERQSSVPPRLQQSTEQRMGPKRYSSLRQRSLPETLPPQGQYVGQQGYYTEFSGPNQTEADHRQMPPQLMTQQPPPSNVPPQVLLQQLPPHPPIITLPQNQYPPPTYPPTYPPPPPMNYTAPPAQPPPYTAAPYPGYQPTFTAPPAQPPQDLYQTPGGITYYSPHSQAPVRALPLKRPKAAIPILAPPERVPPRGRGRSSPSNEPEFRGRVDEFENFGEYDLRSVENADEKNE